MKTGTDDRSRARTRYPTGRHYAVVYGGVILSASIMGAFALALDWSHTAIFVAGAILVGVYVPLAVSFLFARSER